MDGIDDGILLGINEGNCDGLDDGKLLGSSDGTLEGRNDGRLLGLEEGELDGIDDGLPLCEHGENVKTSPLVTSFIVSILSILLTFARLNGFTF